MHLSYASLLGNAASAIGVFTARLDPITDTHLLTLSKPRDVSQQSSVQILYANGTGFMWSVFYGPYGIAVDPCNLQQFQWSGDYTDAAVKAINTSDPLVPAQAMWKGVIPRYAGEDSCMIHKKGGDGSPPTLICGPTKKGASVPSTEGPFTYIDDFKRDVQYEDSPMKCKTGARVDSIYHRAWTIEYFG